jgi:hypothetical protein
MLAGNLLRRGVGLLQSQSQPAMDARQNVNGGSGAANARR